MPYIVPYIYLPCLMCDFIFHKSFEKASVSLYLFLLFFKCLINSKLRTKKKKQIERFYLFLLLSYCFLLIWYGFDSFIYAAFHRHCVGGAVKNQSHFGGNEPAFVAYLIGAFKSTLWFFVELIKNLYRLFSPSTIADYLNANISNQHLGKCPVRNENVNRLIYKKLPRVVEDRLPAFFR